MKDENQKDLIKEESSKSENKNQLIVKKQKSEKNKAKGKKEKILVNGLVTILLVIILIDIYILANMGLEKITLPEFDFTENKIYSLSDETKTKLKNIENEVKITLINYEDNETVINFAEKYTILNKNITIEKINDLASRKDIMEEYSLDATDNLIVISSGERKTTIDEYDLYTYDYSTYETIDRTEEAFTNAILDIITINRPKIYFMSNHAEYAVTTYFNGIMNSIEEDVNEVDVLDILVTGEVPADCDTLVITTLSEDITEFEKDKIIEYINRGGKLLILNGADVKEKNLSNYQQILDLYGITIEEGIIFEGDTSNMLYQYPDFIIENMEYSSLTENIKMNLKVCLADATSIKLNTDKQEELNVEYEELVYTSEDAFRRTNLSINSGYKTNLDSENQKMIVGAIANKKINDDTTSKLIIFGNELFVSDMPITIGNYTYYIAELYNNSDVVLNSVAYLNEREDTITIRKQYDSVTYTVTEKQHNIIMAIIFAIPILIIILGIIIWRVRIRKK